MNKFFKDWLYHSFLYLIVFLGLGLFIGSLLSPIILVKGYDWSPWWLMIYLPLVSFWMGFQKMIDE